MRRLIGLFIGVISHELKNQTDTLAGDGRQKIFLKTFLKSSQSGHFLQQNLVEFKFKILINRSHQHLRFYDLLPETD